MARTNEPTGWTSQFREIVLSIDARLHDIRGGDPAFLPALDPGNYAQSQALGARQRALGSDGVAYPSLRYPGGECVGTLLPRWGQESMSQVGASTIIGMARASICAGILGAVRSIASCETARDIWAPRLTLATCYSPSALHVGRGAWLSRSITPHIRLRPSRTYRRPWKAPRAIAGDASDRLASPRAPAATAFHGARAREARDTRQAATRWLRGSLLAQGAIMRCIPPGELRVGPRLPNPVRIDALHAGPRTRPRSGSTLTSAQAVPCACSA